MRENSIVFLKIIFSSCFVFPRCYIPYTHRTNNIYHPESQSEKSRLSGNAGLFSTADDLAIFARMMLNFFTQVSCQTSFFKSFILNGLNSAEEDAHTLFWINPIY